MWLKMKMIKKSLIPMMTILMSGCSPLLGAGSLVHAVVTGNTTAQVIGASDIVIERNTGKSVKEHIWQALENTQTIENEQTIVWQYIEMERTK